MSMAAEGTNWRLTFEEFFALPTLPPYVAVSWIDETAVEMFSSASSERRAPRLAHLVYKWEDETRTRSLTTKWYVLHRARSYWAGKLCVAFVYRPLLRVKAPTYPLFDPDVTEDIIHLEEDERSELDMLMEKLGDFANTPLARLAIANVIGEMN
jgi:hypothetical protein